MSAREVASTVLLWSIVMAATGIAGAEAPRPRPRAEVEAVLAKAPKPPAEGELKPLHIVLLADVKDHGKEEHDYPRWPGRTPRPRASGR